MEYAHLTRLKQAHPALRLLNADSAPLVVSFLHRAFIRPNARSIRQAELVEQLDDYLHQLRDRQGASYPRKAQAYLDDWAGPSAYLRKYYPPGSDEPEFDLTPATEQAIEWLGSLGARQFVGTESRLLTVFQLLREIVQATETDPDARIAELERRKQELEREIEKVRLGQLDPYSPTQVKERFLQAEELARKLLSDFRQVEENFRALDRATRERIATSTARKGELLDAIFGEQDAISDSDQGRSFRAFWTFMLSPARQDELHALVDRVLALEPVRELESGELLPEIKYRLMEAGEKVQRTSATLIEQLRRYLDDRIWLENKRIVEVIQAIESRAIALRGAPPDDRALMEVDDFKPGIELPMARLLTLPSDKPRLDSAGIAVGQSAHDADALFEQRHIDVQALEARIRRLLGERSQVTLAEVVEAFPLSQGLAEVVAYMHLACAMPHATIDESRHEALDVESGAGRRTVTVPTVIFTR